MSLSLGLDVIRDLIGPGVAAVLVGSSGVREFLQNEKKPIAYESGIGL